VKAPLFLLVAPLALGACGGSSAPTSTATPTESLPAPPPPSTATETTALPVPLEVFFLRDGKLAAARRDVAATRSVGTAALTALFAGPNAEERQAGLTSAVSAAAGWSLAINNGVASVQLSREMGDAARAQLTYTLTQFPTVRSVKVGGRIASRADFEQLTPAILIESPVVGDSATSPLRVSGTANTFEATFTLELRTGGRLLDKRTLTATSGSGMRGTFQAEIPFKVSEETRADLVAYELSAKDGKPINKVSVPIGLLP
jgi:germination protein M